MVILFHMDPSIQLRAPQNAMSENVPSDQTHLGNLEKDNGKPASFCRTSLALRYLNVHRGSPGKEGDSACRTSAVLEPFFPKGDNPTSLVLGRAQYRTIALSF